MKIKWLPLVIFYLLPVAYPLWADSYSIYQCSLRSMEKLRHKGVLLFPGGSIFVLEESAKGEHSYWGLGLSLPWLELGNLSPKGLIKEIDNPGAFSADSTVFKEKSLFRTDPSFRANPARGLFFRPFPERLALYYLDTSNKKQSGGFIGELAPPAWDNMSVLLTGRFTGGADREGKLSDLSKKGFTLGANEPNYAPLGHFAAQFACYPPGVRTSSALGLSFSPLYPPGCFIRIYLAVKKKYSAFSCTGCFISSEYFTGAGTKQKDLFSIRYSGNLKFPGQEVLYSRGGFVFKQENREYDLYTSINWNHPAKGCVFNGAIGGSLHRDESPEGQIKAGLYLKPLKSEIQYKLNLSDGGPALHTLVFSGNWGDSPLRISAGGGYKFGDKEEFRFSVKARYTFSEGSAVLSIDTGGWKKTENFIESLQPARFFSIEFSTVPESVSLFNEDD